MDQDTVFGWVRAERLSFADLLADLDEHEWAAASLCAGWTVRDVAAHMTTSVRTVSTGAAIRDTVRAAIRARGDFNRMIFDEAREIAVRLEPAELVAKIRKTAGSRTRSLGSGPMDPLVDALVHGQDVARPLGRIRQMPAEPAVAALDYVRGRSFYGAAKRLRGTRQVATDLDWSAGEGPAEVRGPVADLLLVATGRSAGLAGLSGPGAERIAAVL